MKHILSTAVFLGLIFGASPLFAAKMYKYQDDQGNWHYTDKKPGTGVDVEEIRIKAKNEKSLFRQVWVREETLSSPKLTVVNNYHGPIVANLKAKCQKCSLAPAREVSLFVEGDSEALAFNIISDSNSWTVDYEIEISLGDPDAQHAPNAVYGLPVPMDEYFLITQGFNGPFSHQDVYNRYAIDIAMKIGTPVLAARRGTVMAIEEGFRTAGLHQDYADKANVIYILHDDGTIAIYAHLDMNSAYVKLGDKVERGDIIARSGNTGFSSGPHLHFNVQKNFKNGEQSIPIKFDQGKGEKFIPIAGQELKWDIYSVVDARISMKHKALYEQTLALEEAKQEESEAQDNDIKSKFKGLLKDARSFIDNMLEE